MQDVRLVPYQKKFNYSYSFGVYPTIELLENRSKEVVKVLLHSRGKQNEGLRKIQVLCQKNGIRTEWADGLIKKITDSENTYAVGVFNKYTCQISAKDNQVVLVSPEDTGNLGTILRSALGFGVGSVVIIKPAVDIFDPKVVRASMGAIFKLQVRYFDDFGEYVKAQPLKKYLFMTDGKQKLETTEFEKPFALVFGSESSGINDEYRSLGTTVTIEQSKEIDSLNLSVAVGIALHRSFTS